MRILISAVRHGADSSSLCFVLGIVIGVYFGVGGAAGGGAAAHRPPVPVHATAP